MHDQGAQHPDAPDLPVRDDPATGENARRPHAEPAVDDGPPVLPDVALDDTDRGWGDDLREAGSGRDRQWYQRERPPHWE
jgi:hypothetical protein